MTTEIFNLAEDHENMFSHLLSQRAQAVLYRDGAYGIGIAAYRDEKLIPAGTLVFAVDLTEDMPDMPSVMELFWLYVDEEFRHMGVGTRLMEVFAEIVNDSDVDSIICDVPLDSSCDELVGMLEGWGIRFVLTEKNEYILTWDDIKDNPNLTDSHKSDCVFSLKDISEEMLEDVLRTMQIKRLEEFIVSEMDFSLSCVYLQDSIPEGIFLIRRRPGYMFEPVLIMVRDDSEIPEKVSKELISSALYNVPEADKKESFVYIQIRSLTGAKIWDDMFPDNKPALVRRGIIMLKEPDTKSTRP